MKKLTNLMVAILVILSLTGSSCLRETKRETKQETSKIQKNDILQKIASEEAALHTLSVHVEKGNLKLMIDFIKKRGSDISMDNSHNYLYTFVDSKKVSHDIFTAVALNKDTSLTGKIQEIYILPSLKEKKQKKLYAYKIDEDWVCSIGPKDRLDFDHMIRIYSEFLTFVKDKTK